MSPRLPHSWSWLIGAALALSLSQGASAEAPPSLPFSLKMIGPGVYAAVDGPEHKSGSNAGFIVGDDAVLVVDSFFDPQAAAALLGEIRKITPKPVRYVVNTHYHMDHVAGDQVFKDAGAIIIAHKNVRGWIRTENPHLFGDRITDALKAAIAHLPFPDVTTDTGLTVWLGARRVDISAVEGHTGGDLVVSAPDAHVLFCGDMLWNKISPNLIDGTVKRWIETDNQFLKRPDAASTVYVPGHGDIADQAAVADFKDYLGTLVQLTSAARAKGMTGEALVQAVMAPMTARYGTWLGFRRSAPLEIGFVAQELDGVKRVPRPVGD